MCEHREHRTGNCRECDAIEAARPTMPQVWEGDDA